MYNNGRYNNVIIKQCTDFVSSIKISLAIYLARFKCDLTVNNLTKQQQTHSTSHENTNTTVHGKVNSYKITISSNGASRISPIQVSYTRHRRRTNRFYAHKLTKPELERYNDEE